MGLLDFAFSQGDRMKRHLGGLLADPIGSIQQTAGLLSDFRRQDQELNATAFANPQNPLQVTSKAALGQLGDRMLAGPLSFAPAGMILATGYTPKSGLPESIRQNRVTPIAKSLPPNPRYDTVGNVYDDMNLRIAKLQDGNYVAQYDQPWMGKVKPFYATGDDVDELLSYGLDRIQRSQSASTAAAKRQYRATLLGQLEVGGMDPNDFQLAKSQRSSSTYLTHIPSGTKVRVSDHDLPLGYEQPDIDLRHSQSVLEQAEKVLKYLRQ